MNIRARRLLIAGAGLALLAAALLVPRPGPERPTSRTARRVETPAAPAPVTPPPPALAAAAPTPQAKPVKNPLDKMSMGIAAAPAGGGADFVLRDRIANAFFTSQGVTFGLVGPSTPGGGPSERIAASLRWGLEGAAEVKARPEGERPGKVNVFKGDPSTWKKDAPTYSSMVYDDVRPGVDLTVESRPMSLKYTVQAARAADIGDLRFRYAGARQVRVVEGGAAVEVDTPNGRLREDGLAVWQDGPGGRVPVEARYVESGADGVEISLGPVDPELPLTVDPVISWSDYLGGAVGSLGEDYAYGVDADAAGNVYVAGYTFCINLPGIAVGQVLKGTVDGFLMKLNTVTGTIAWANYIGGSALDFALAVALDGQGNPVVTGYTTSTDFPFTAGAHDTSPPIDGKEDAFVIKFNAAGAPLWGTYLGGQNADYGYAIRVDPATGDVYIGGQTTSLNFPIVGGFDVSLGGTADGFVAKLNAAGSTLLWSTLLGGGDTDVVSSIALDPSGNVYATGATSSSDFPTPGGPYTTYGGNTDAFLSKIAQTVGPPVTPQLQWSTYLGGASTDVGHGVTVTTDTAQEPVVVGYTNSPGFPLLTPIDGSLSGIDAFVTRVRSTGGGLVYSTFLGGVNADYAYGVAAGALGSVYVTGQTQSPGFPTTLGAYRTTMVGTPDGFVTQVDAAGATLLASTFLGGAGAEVPRAVAANALGVFVAGSTGSTNLPQPAPLMIDATLGGTQDGFMARLAPTLISVARASYVGGVNSLGDDFGTCVAVDPRNGDVIVAGYTNSLDYTSGPGMDLILSGLYDAFVTRLTTVAGAPSIMWSTYLGGSGDENGYGLAVDRLGFPYLVGHTTSSNFPLVSASPPPNQNLVFDATYVATEGFLTCLNPDDGTIFYSTFMGGSGADYARAVAVDTNFNAFVTGYTYSANFPTGSAFDGPGALTPDAFVACVDVYGLGKWSSYISGNDHDQGMGITVNEAGTRVVVTGFTHSTDFVTPAIVPAPPMLNGQANVFAAGITGAGALTWSRYLGGLGHDYGYAVAMDPGLAGGTSAVVTGFTHSPDFPTLNPIDPDLSGPNDVFATRLDPTTGATVWSTYLGGTNFDYGLAVALDASANVYLCGYTLSSDFPLDGAVDSTFSEGVDAFVTKLNPNGSLAWSTYLGGSGNDVAMGIAVDSTGVVYVTGETLSNDFPGAVGLNGVRDAFIVRLDNANPDPPNLAAAGTGQFKLNTTTPIGVGTWSNETGFVVKAIIADSDDQPVALQVEIQPVNTAFTGTPTTQTALFPSGTLVSLSVTFPGAAPQSYHWRARTVDNPTTPVRTSSWVSFGGNLDAPLPAARDVGRDTAPPAPAITSPTSSTTYYTQSASVALGGTSADDASASGVATVTWTTNGAVSPAPTFGSATGAPPWATWTIPSIALAAGPNLITVTATDAAGNAGTDQITVHRDNTPPTVSITIPAANPFVTGSNSVNMSGSASDLVSLFRVTWSNDRGTSGTATLLAGTWSATVTLASGLNVITVTAEDSAGNTSTAQRTINYDATPPVIGITSPVANAATASANVNMNGPVTDNVQVSTVTWQNQSMAPPNTGNATVTGTTWTALNVPLVAGANTIQVTATDGVGLSSSSSVTVYRDTTDPTVTITLPTPNPTFTTGAATIDLGGGSTDDIGVQTITWARQAPPGTPIDAGVGVVANPGSPSSTWSIGSIPLLSNLANQITVTVTDRVGKQATDVITVTNSSSAPSVVVSSPPSNPFPTSASSIVVSGSASDDTTVNSVTVTNTTTGQVPAVTAVPGLGVPSLTWSATVTLVDGNNVITIQANDGASTTTVSITVIRDSTAPTVKITGPTTADDYFTGTPTLVLTGTVADNRPGTTVAWSTTAAVVPASGAATVTTGWSTPAINLVAGSQVITVTATDAVGNPATDTLTVVYDPTKPDISITSPTSSDTYVTNAATVALGGSASDNALLGGVTWANAATGASGPASVNGLTWSVATLNLNPGSNVITVIATDAAGNLKTDTITVFYDTAAPSVAIVSPSASPTHATNAATTGLAGTASDDVQVVSVGWVNAGNGASGTAVGTVSWSASAVSLAPGNNAITVTVTDAVGGTSTDLITIHYDPNAPSIAITSPVATPTHSTTGTPIDLAGTASDLTGTSSVVDVTQVTWDNLTTGGSGAGALTPGAWSASVPLTSGLNTILVTAKDAAGNTSTDSIAVTYDPAAPLVVITTPTTGLSYTTGSTPVVFSGTASDDVGVVSVTWSTTGAVVPNSGPAAGTTSWSASIPLMPGSNVITITATDGVGRFGTSRVTVVYDPTPPAVTITTPTADTVFLTTTSSIAIGGSATDNIGLQAVSWVNAATGVNGVAQGTGAWSVSSVALVEGPNLITVTATDGVGNVGQDILTVIFDGTPPAVAIDTPTAAATFSTQTRPITIGGTVTDNIQISGVTWTNSLGGGGEAVVTGTATTATWSDSVYLFPGDNVITVTAVDAHGFEATDVLTITFTPETGVPGIAINLPSATGTATSATQLVTVSGTADDGVGVVGVTWRNLGTGVRGAAVLTGPATLVNWTADIPLANGANVIVVTAVDDAGNTASATIVVDFQSGADGVPPTVSVTGPTLADVYDSTVSPLLITISATDDVGVSSVRWTNSGTGGDGTAVPGLGTVWTTTVGLAFGANVITITARDPAGNTAVDTLIVNFVPAPGDAAAPLVTILTPPTGATVNAAGVTLDMAGTASDNVDLATVVWSNPATGETGSADGLNTWTLTLNLAAGINIITVRAYDTSGNTDTDVITVLYTPPPPPPEEVPAGSCGLVGLDAWLLLVGLAAWRRRSTSRAR